ncbi:MAG: MdtA/MuxA family multidrug efflux RND transporter periplasmic adaptor subunit [Acidobacteriia bacterium]|nr:MdtA/MuxA family multidrug efflux RND transporter periplasmic adaptor subunit [Terriglobia bacterium]
MNRNLNWRWMQLSGTLLLLLAFGGCQTADSPKGKNALAATTRAVPVAVASAVEQDMPVYLTGLGSVTAYNTVSVKSRVDGQLIQVNFREGQQVNKGDLLILIDPRPYQVQLASAQAQLYKDQAQLRDAQLNYQRFKDLLQQSGAMSQQQVDTQKAMADQFEGAVRADQAAIDNAKLQLVYCHITAPVSGHIGLRLVDAGNIVHASDANPMLVITQLQPISVIFTLPEDSLPAVVKRMKQGTLKVDAYDRDDKNKLATGTLLTIDNQIDQTTGTDRLKATFDNKDGVLFPNQFVNIHLLLDVRKNSTIVPSVAVQRGPQGSFVYVVKADKTVEARTVTVALTQSNQSAIGSGLQVGEVVVTDGQDKLQNGAKVETRSGTGNSKTSQSSSQSTTQPGTAAPMS